VVAFVIPYGLAGMDVWECHSGSWLSNIYIGNSPVDSFKYKKENQLNNLNWQTSYNIHSILVQFL